MFHIDHWYCSKDFLKILTYAFSCPFFLCLCKQNLKAQKSRREQFSGSSPVVNDLPAGALTGGPFASQNGTKGSVLLRDEYHANGGDAVTIDMAGADDRARLQAQQTVFSDDTEYLQSRSDAVQSIESTIVELGGIFQQLALMVREQEEMVQR